MLAMHALKQSLRRIPYWAYLLVLLVVFVNTIYLIYRFKSPVTGENEELINNHWIINYIEPGGPIGKTEIKIGDTLVSCNSYTIEEWSTGWHGQFAGDTLIIGVLRNNQEVEIPVIPESSLASAPGFLCTAFLFIILFSTGSLFLLYKKPGDKAVNLFFIYLQCLLMTFNSLYLPFSIPLSVFANVAFIFSGGLFGPVLIQF